MSAAVPTLSHAGYPGPAWLPGAHAQTIYPYFLPRPAVAYRRERIETADGDFWDFDWLVNTTPPAPAAPLVVVFHGLEGSARSHYALALMHALDALGWRGVVPHFRGCSGEPNRLPRAYHSGDHEEIGAMLAAIGARHPAGGPVYAVGVSLGGSALLNWIGRAGADAQRFVAAAATVSAPLDLMAAGIAIGQGMNRLYTLHFLQTLKPKARALLDRHPGVFDGLRLRHVRSMWDFDDLVTGPLHGFTGVQDYWTRASSRPWLGGVAIPTLVVNAQNDPFIPLASLPGMRDVSASVVLERPARGGHAGFLVGPAPGSVAWLPQRLLHFFQRGY